MNAARKIAARLRTEDTDRLPKLLQLYPHETKAIQTEINRRQLLCGLPPSK